MAHVLNDAHKQINAVTKALAKTRPVNPTESAAGSPDPAVSKGVDYETVLPYTLTGDRLPIVQCPFFRVQSAPDWVVGMFSRNELTPKARYPNSFCGLPV